MRQERPPSCECSVAMKPFGLHSFLHSRLALQKNHSKISYFEQACVTQNLLSARTCWFESDLGTTFESEGVGAVDDID